MMLTMASALPPFSLNLWQDVAGDALVWLSCGRRSSRGRCSSVVAGLVGTFVVLRHQAFAGEALSDVAFTGALGGAALGINPLVTLLATTIVAALGMGALGERLRGRDVAIGTVLAWVLGLGVLFLISSRRTSAGRGRASPA